MMASPQENASSYFIAGAQPSDRGQQAETVTDGHSKQVSGSSAKPKSQSKLNERPLLVDLPGMAHDSILNSRFVGHNVLYQNAHSRFKLIKN